MQVGRVAAAVVAAGAVISGCGGPNQAGSAVIVGNDSVPLSRVQSQLDTAFGKTDAMAQLAAQGGTASGLGRSIVTSEVMHDVLARSAAQAGIVVTEDQVDAQLAKQGGMEAIADGSLYDLPALRDMPTERERVRDNLIAMQLGQRAVGGLAVTGDLVTATSRADAEAKARTLAAGGPAADALFNDPGSAARDQALQAAPFLADPRIPMRLGALFTAPAGSVVAFPPDPQQNSWFVFRVTDRHTDAPSDPAIAGLISPSRLVGLGEYLAQPTVEQVGVRLNPRYGVWDPTLPGVAPADQAGMVITPPAAD